MSRIAGRVTGILLIAGFALYAASPLRLSGPADKAVQFILLLPACVILAFSFRNPFRGFFDFFHKMPSPVFVGTLGLFVFSFTLLTALFPLEGIPKGGDEAAYYFQSRIFARGLVSAPVPDAASPRNLFPFRHFIFTDTEWFVMYTPLHGLLMAPLSSVGISWLLGPVQSVISLIGIYLFARILAGEGVARTATAFIALSPFFLFMGASHMAHNSNLMFVSWALYALASGILRRNALHQAAAGFLFGLALNTKPYPVIPWTLSIVSVLFLYKRWKAVPVILRMAAGAVIPVLFFLAANYRYTGDPFSPAYNLARGGALVGFGSSAAWFPEYGDHAHTPLRGLINLAKQAGAGSTILLGWPFLSLLPPLGVLLDRKTALRSWPLFIPTVFTALFMFAHYSASIDYGPRHYYTLLPVFALLCALGFREAVREWGDKVVQITRWLFLICTAAVYLPDGIELRSGPWQAIDSEPVRLAGNLISGPAVVFMEATEHGYPNVMSGFIATDPFLDGDIVFCAHQTPEEDLDHIEGLFSGREPYLYWSEEGTGHLAPWSDSLAALLSPEVELRPEWAPMNLNESAL